MSPREGESNMFVDQSVSIKNELNQSINMKKRSDFSIGSNSSVNMSLGSRSLGWGEFLITEVDDKEGGDGGGTSTDGGGRISFHPQLPMVDEDHNHDNFHILPKAVVTYNNTNNTYDTSANKANKASKVTVASSSSEEDAGLYLSQTTSMTISMDYSNDVTTTDSIQSNTSSSSSLDSSSPKNLNHGKVIVNSLEQLKGEDSSTKGCILNNRNIIRPTLYITADDLNAKVTPSTTTTDEAIMKEHPHLYKPSPNTTLSNSKSDDKTFIALNQYADLTNQTPSPIIHQALDELYIKSYNFTSNLKLWKASERKTEKISSQQSSGSSWHGLSIPTHPIRTISTEVENIVLSWTGSVGSFTCVRCEAVIPGSAEEVYDLMMDSSRAKEYNKLSMGREDVWTMKEEEEEEGENDETSSSSLSSSSMWRGTKVVEGKNKPPMVRKPIEFRSLLHGRELNGNAGYLIASRSVKRLQDDGSMMIASSTMSNDLLIGSNLILRIDGEKDKCVLVNASQFKAVSMPAMLVKKMCVTGGISMLQDIQKVFR